LFSDQQLDLGYFLYLLLIWKLNSISIIVSFSIVQTPTVRPRVHHIVIISCPIQSSMHGWKETFSVLSKRQMSIVFVSVQSAAGSTLSVRQRKMLDLLFSGLSVGRRSLRDWRPAVRTGMKWQRLAGASPWCSLIVTSPVLLPSSTQIGDNNSLLKFADDCSLFVIILIYLLRQKWYLSLAYDQ